VLNTQLPIEYGSVVGDALKMVNDNVWNVGISGRRECVCECEVDRSQNEEKRPTLVTRCRVHIHGLAVLWSDVDSASWPTGPHCSVPSRTSI